jgi:hypothetical protein
LQVSHVNWKALETKEYLVNHPAALKEGMGIQDIQDSLVGHVRLIQNLGVGRVQKKQPSVRLQNAFDALDVAVEPAEKREAARALYRAKRQEAIDGRVANLIAKANSVLKSKPCKQKPAVESLCCNGVLTQDRRVWGEEITKFYGNLFCDTSVVVSAGGSCQIDPVRRAELVRKQKHRIAALREAKTQCLYKVEVWRVLEARARSRGKEGKAPGPDQVSWSILHSSDLGRCLRKTLKRGRRFLRYSSWMGHCTCALNTEV